jgi:NAD(P)H-dependent flavin oxidoreductase YrpB (nitropropane dioxygenase family)
MTGSATLPEIIQGGMGVAVSDWRLARAVSIRGHLGVVSGTGIDNVLVRRLQDGDPAGDVRRAMAAFPIPGVAEQVLDRYFLAGGRAAGAPYRSLAMNRPGMGRGRELVNVLAGFVEVYLAKEGHDGQVGMNLLTKVQLPTLATLYGAMLAGVGWILMGAGIPREIPGALDLLARHEAATLRFDVEGLDAGRDEYLRFAPRDLWAPTTPALTRPRFLAIIASTSLATVLARKASGHVDGFIIEGPTAGGHNAPPRGQPTYNPRGEPVYGERDVVDLAKVAELGRPFWLAGGTGRRGALAEARATGAAGIQVGTLFAYSDESGLDPALRTAVLAHVASGDATILTDPRASPTGYPFKLVSYEGAPDSDDRERICDLGYLRVAYQRPDGGIGFRCASEPVEDYARKGGDAADTVGRKCLCNALMADIGIGQVRADGRTEPPLLTSGDDLLTIGEFLAGRDHYSASDVLEFLAS